MFEVMTNGLGGGSSLTRLLQAGMNPAVLRPFMEEDRWGRPTGRNLISVNVGADDKGQPIAQNFLTNAPTTLRRQDWLLMDQAVQEAARPTERIWADVYGTNPVDIPNGMGVISVGDTYVTSEGVATIGMDPIRRTERNRPTFDTRQMPLPVIWSDGFFSGRGLNVARANGIPLDTAGLQTAARTVATDVNKLVMGTSPSFSYGGGTVYGLVNHPQRLIATLTNPSAGGWSPKLAVTEFRGLVTLLENNGFPGPFVCYYGKAWGEIFDKDYSDNYAGETIRTRIDKIDKLRGRLRPAEELTGFQVVVVQMTRDVVEGLNGMDITAVQWEEEGGFELRFKVLCIHVPRVRSNPFTNKVGIVEANTGA